MKNKFYINDIDSFIKSLYEDIDEFKDINTSLRIKENDKFQDELIELIDSHLDEATIKYMSILHHTRNHNRENVLKKYLGKRLPQIFPKKSDIVHALETKSVSRKTNKIKTKLVNPTPFSLDDGIPHVSEAQIEYLVDTNPADFLHMFRDHDFQDIEVLSVSNKYVRESTGESVSIRIKRNERESKKTVDRIVGIGPRIIYYDGSGSLEILKDSKKAYDSVDKIIRLGDDKDKMLGLEIKYHALPINYNESLVNQSEKNAKKALQDILTKVRKNKNYVPERDNKLMPGIQIKRHFGSVPMETQLYTPGWFNFYDKYHKLAFVQGRADKRIIDAKNAGLDKVVQYLDEKFKPIFTLNL
ncbi:MAG: hypothetical protein ACMXX9_03780 [Candidatus Woesearchaeota archaeon]